MTSIKTFLSKVFLLHVPWLVVVFLVATFMVAVPVSAADYAQLNGQVDLGDRNGNVSNLQRFLAADTSLYPEALVTGYYGILTQAAVNRFQARYGIEIANRVGPITMAKINNLIVGGNWGVTDVSGPAVYSVGRSTSPNAAMFTWQTNENATAKIFYSTSPVTMNEGDINSVGFGATSGFTALNDGLARTSQQVTINGLQPGTQYYYVIVATDLTGNVSVWNPNTTFRTN